MNDVPPLIIIDPKDNPLYPLPADYGDLTSEGQRLARLNGCRQWLIKEPGASHAIRRKRLIGSHLLFDRYYLHPTDGYDPQFYDSEPLPIPDMHFDILGNWAVYNRCLAVAPRGSAKSTLGKKDTLMRLVTRPGYSMVYATSNGDNTKGMGQDVRDQCYENVRIVDDWGKMKPARGTKMTGTTHFYLNNNSWLRCVSVQSKLRGLRPIKFRLDDPEYDASASSSMYLIREFMERLLFKVALPMLMRQGSSIDWTATFVSRQHFAWQAMNTLDSPEGPLAEDPRFNTWARLLIKAATVAEDGTMHSCWPEMWPPTIASKKGTPYEEARSLEEIKLELGPAVFASEYQGEPGAAEDSFFKIDPDPKGRHAYWLEDADESMAIEPLRSNAVFCRRGEDGSTLRENAGQAFSAMHRFMTVDLAFTESATSDRRVCHVQGLNSDNELLSLDLWSARKPDNVLAREVLTRASKWRVSVIYVEVVRESVKFYERLRSMIQTSKADLMTKYGWVPAVKPLKPPSHLTKSAKIEMLDWRVEQCKVKLPLWRKHNHAAYARLFNQFDCFNPEANDGGLDHDDEIDTMSMSTLIIKGKPGRSNVGVLEDGPKSYGQAVIDGEMPLNVSLMTQEEVFLAMASADKATGDNKI